LTLRPTSSGSNSRVVDIDVGDVDLLELVGSCAIGCRPCRLPSGASVASTSLSWRPTVSAKDEHRALHALEQVHAHQVDQALFAVDLPEDALAAADGGAVLLVVGRQPAFLHVAQRRVAGELQAPDLEVDLLDRPELARTVDVGLDVDGRQATREAARLFGAVVLLDVARDRAIVR
jgi:hypothetical protein